MSKQFYITTAICYVNSTPHIGNMLTMISGDVTARYERMRGEDVYFQVGTDENGLKIKEAAEAKGMQPLAFVDDMVSEFKRIFEGLKISGDDFIRTTEPRHARASQELFERLRENGYVYEGAYEGWYDVSTETFYKDADLVDGRSPDGNEVRWVTEQNWFFKLSAFGDRLLEHIRANPNFILPENRKNEVVSFIEQGLRDICITRTNQGWGIPVPGEPGKVIYVWFDALINYLASAGWPDGDWGNRWPAEVMWLGKDILTRFHATLWPAMLMGAELPLPKAIVAHGWILLGKDKISKSRGNVVLPLELAKTLSDASGCSMEVAVDAVRHFDIATMNFEGDSSYSDEEFFQRYNSDLANDLGNALNRSLVMAQKFSGGSVPSGPSEPEMIAAITAAQSEFDQAMTVYRLRDASSAAWGLVRFINKYIDTRAPWALAKAEDPALGAVIRSLALGLRAAEGLLRPILPATCDEVAKQLGLPPLTDWSKIGDESDVPGGHVLGSPVPIFPRLDLNKMKQPEEIKSPPETKPMSKPEPPAQIGIEDFMKIQLRVARILEAEPVEGSAKLLKLQVVIGDEQRQILAGIQKSYQPMDLIGRQVIVVANLKSAKLMGQESQGMILAADGPDGTAILLQPEAEAPEGTSVH